MKQYYLIKYYKCNKIMIDFTLVYISVLFVLQCFIKCCIFRVMVLDQGKIGEFASPQDLLQDENSMFYSMAADAGLV